MSKCVYENGNFRVYRRNNLRWSVTELSDNILFRHCSYKRKSYAIVWTKTYMKTRCNMTARAAVENYVHEKYLSKVKKKKEISKGEFFKAVMQDKKTSKYSKDTNDCTVVAFSILTGWDYTKSNEALKEMGRKFGKGFSYTKRALKNNGFLFETFIRHNGKEELKNYVYDIQKIIGYDKTVTSNQIQNHKKELSELLKGKCLVRINRHVFAMIDGVIQDYNPKGSAKIWYVYKLS